MPIRSELPTLPVLDTPSLPARPPRAGARPDTGLEEYGTETTVLPSFHVWTLGCQMNMSDSEEMAGALLAAGCSEAPGIEQADLIVINTCSIREAAEHKVIGRMGALGRLKEANPALRVVLTGCSVRADNQGVLQRRYPAVDLFLRPDEEPELTARLGLAGLTTADQLGGGGVPARRPLGRRHRRPPARHPCRGGRGGAHRAQPRRQGLGAHRLRLRQDLHVLHRALRTGPRAQPAVRRHPRRGRPAGRGRLPRAHPAGPERQLLGPRPGARPALRRHRRPA